VTTTSSCVTPSVHTVGVGVLPQVLDPGQVADARRTVLEHRNLLRNTRPTPSAGHLAGFHRYPQLEPLHCTLSQYAEVQACVAELCGPEARTIGMTDITVNRSQPWHKDLLRGPYRKYLGVADPCARWHGTVFKFLVYLQAATSLAVENTFELSSLCLESIGISGPICRFQGASGGRLTIRERTDSGTTT